jgi:hypothetical protein
MVLLVHILIALSSVAFSTLSIFAPSDKKIKINYAFLAATWISGFFLVFQSNVSFGHLCLSGILYTGVVSMNIYLTKRRLAAQEAPVEG